MPKITSQPPWTAAEQARLLNDPGYAATVSAQLTAAASTGGSDGIAGTLRLLSDSGIQVVGSVGDSRVYMPARRPWVLPTQVRAGQAIALAELLRQHSMYSLKDFLTLVRQTSGGDPAYQFSPAVTAAALAAELVSARRNPVWAAVILGGVPAKSALYQALQSIASGHDMTAVADVSLNAAQFTLMLLRMREELVGVLKYLASASQAQPARATAARSALSAGSSGSAIQLMAAGGPCWKLLDNPWIDTTVDLGANAWSKYGWEFVEKWLKNGPIPGTVNPYGNPEGVTAGELSAFLGAASLASTMVNMVLIKSLIAVDVSAAPNPLQRTKEFGGGARGAEGQVHVHAYVSDTPVGPYADCARLLLAAAAAGSYSIPKSGPLAKAPVKYTIGNPEPVVFPNVHETTADGSTDNNGDAATEIWGRGQSHDLSAAATPVMKSSDIDVTVDPNGYESAWLAAYKGVAGALEFGMGTLTVKKDPKLAVDALLKAALQAANYLGWIHSATTLNVNDWADKLALNYQVHMTYDEPPTTSPFCGGGTDTYSQTLDYRLEGSVPLTQAPDGSWTGSGKLSWTGVPLFDSVERNVSPPLCNPSLPMCTGVTTTKLTGVTNGLIGVTVRNIGMSALSASLQLTGVSEKTSSLDTETGCPSGGPSSTTETYFLDVSQLVASSTRTYDHSSNSITFTGWTPGGATAVANAYSYIIDTSTGIRAIVDESLSLVGQ